jgi:DNA-binding XRE family transcriptional regulator
MCTPDCNCYEFPVLTPAEVREYRKSFGYSQQGFADAFGLTPSMVITMEGGAREKSRFQAWQELVVSAIATLCRKNHQMLAVWKDRRLGDQTKRQLRLPFFMLENTFAKFPWFLYNRYIIFSLSLLWQTLK